MPSIEPSADEAAMLAAGLGLGDYAYRVDLKKFMRCIALPSNTIGNFAIVGTPAGSTIYQDPITSEWMFARKHEGFTPFAKSTEAPAAVPNWHGVIYGAFGDCNPQTMMTLLHCAGAVAPTPTNIGTSVARLAYFTPPANITVNRIRFYGVGATTNVYRVAIYNLATLARLTAELPFTTASGTWGAAGSSLGLSLVAGTRYLIAVSVNATGTTAGIAAFGPSTAVTTGGQGVVPTSFPGSLDFDSGFLTGSFATATVVTGALPATLGTPAAAGNWTGGFPAFWLDSNNG